MSVCVMSKERQPGCFENEKRQAEEVQISEVDADAECMRRVYLAVASTGPAAISTRAELLCDVDVI